MLSLFRKVKQSGARAGLAMASDGFALASVKQRAGTKPALEHFATHALANGDVEKTLVETVGSLQLQRARMSAVIGSEDYQLVQVEAPEVLPSELRTAVRWRLRDVITFHIDDATVDVFEIPDQSRRAQKMMFAIAARNDAVKQIVNFVTPHVSGFDVIDIPELCLRNLSSLLPQDEKGVALLVLEQNFAHLVLTRQGTLYLTRRIDLSRSYSYEGGSDIDASALALELQRSLDYYESNYDHPPIAEMVIAPAGGHAERLATALKDETGLRISLLDLSTLVDAPNGLPGEITWPMLLALGAALRTETVEL